MLFCLGYCLALISLVFKILKLVNGLTLLVTLLAVYFLFLEVLLLDKVVFVIKLLVETSSNSRECEALGNISFLKPALDLIFKYNELIFHFRINVSFLVSRPESPKSITDNIIIFCPDFFTKNVFPELQ